MKMTYQRNSRLVNKKYSEYFLPTVLTAMANNVAIILGGLIVSNVLGNTAAAAMNVTMPFLQISFSFTILFGMGASAIISVAKGKRDTQYANRVFTAVFLILILVSAILVILQVTFIDQICSFLAKDDEVRALMKEYFLPIAYGTPLLIILPSATYCIRTDGKPKLASNILIIANIANLAFAWLLIAVMGVGVSGASIANIAGYFVGFLVMLSYFFSKSRTLRFDFSILKDIKAFGRLAGNVCAVGASGALGTMLITFKLAGLNLIIQSAGGTLGVSAFVICSACQTLMSMFVTGASQTMIPIIGVFYGERDNNGIKYAFNKALKILMIASLALMLVMEIAPQLIVSIYNFTDPQLVAMCIPAIRIFAVSFPGLAITFLALYYFMAIQKKNLSIMISIVSGIAIILPCAYIMTKFMGINGVWMSFNVANYGTLIILWIVLKIVIKRSKGKYTDLFLLEQSKEDVAALSYQGTTTNAVDVSKQTIESLTERGVPYTVANKIGIALEEMAVNSEKLSAKKGKPCDIDIRIRVQNGEIVIAMRDNGEYFDPTVYNEKEKTEYTVTGIQLVTAIAKKIEYTRVLGLNQTTIIVQNT